MDDGRAAGPTAPATVVAVLLAAGAGSRFAGDHHKLTARLDGRSVAGRALDAVVASGIGPVVIVTGAVALADLASAEGSVHTVHNPDWARGQSTSLRVGIAAAAALGAQAVVVGLADQPSISPTAWRRVAAAEGPIAVATYGGRRRNPVKLERSVWPSLPDDGDEGARVLMRCRPELVREVPCPGSPHDIDTLEDLSAWQSRSSTSSR